MRNNQKIIAALGFVSLLLAAGCSDPATTTTSPTIAAVASAAPVVTVASINGTGCAAGTATATPAADGSSITVVYTAFTAKAGAGSTPTEFRRNCQLNIQITSPGQTYAVSSVIEHGAISIPTGGSVLQRTNYYLQGNATGTPVDHTATGPQSGAWDQTDDAPFTAPCGTTKNLNINVELRVTTSGGTAASLSLNGTTPGTTVSFTYTSCP